VVNMCKSIAGQFSKQLVGKCSEVSCSLPTLLALQYLSYQAGQHQQAFSLQEPADSSSGSRGKGEPQLAAESMQTVQDMTGVAADKK
jgi:hypothetical protein